MTDAGRGLSILVLSAAIGLPTGFARADDAACQAVLDAVVKQAGVPVRQVITIESPEAPGKPLRGEIIRLGDTLYMRAGREWIAKPYDARKAVSDSRQAMQKAPHTCTRVRVDTFDGKEATLYSVKTTGTQGPIPNRRSGSAPTDFRCASRRTCKVPARGCTRCASSMPM